MKGRIAWLGLFSFIVLWDVAAALTNGESLTFAFRRSISDTAWRWPVLIVIVLLTVHLFLPPRLREHDPLDRLYNELSSTRLRQPSDKPPVPATLPRNLPNSGDQPNR
jgi:hypothetical protein